MNIKRITIEEESDKWRKRDKSEPTYIVMREDNHEWIVRGTFSIIVRYLTSVIGKPNKEEDFSAGMVIVEHGIPCGTKDGLPQFKLGHRVYVLNLWLTEIIEIYDSEDN